MRRSGLAPSNIAIKDKQINQVYTVPPQYIQKQAPLQQKPEIQQKQAPPPPPPPSPQQIIYQSNRPNFSGNLPSIRHR
jgi:hypothetical protein